MKRSDLLAEISTGLEKGIISKKDITEIVNKSKAAKSNWHFSLNGVLYILGGIIVTAGIIALVGQLWSDLGMMGRIGVTFILALLLAGIGSLLFTRKQEVLGVVFHAISGALLPFGIMVTLHELVSTNPSIWYYVTAYAVLSGFYALLMAVHRHVLFTALTCLYSTVTLYLFTIGLLENSSLNDGIVLTSLSVLIGASYILLAYWFRTTWNKSLQPLLHFFGVNFLVWSTFARVVNHNDFWLVAFVPLMCVQMYIAKLRSSTAIQTFSTIGLLAYIIYITDRYFADSIGWPISLIVLGFVCIGIGYASVQYTKRFLQK